MKKITLLFALAIFTFITSYGQTTVAVDANETWNGYINAFNLDDSYAGFGFPYGVADMKTDINTTNNTVTCYPNFAIWNVESNNPAWFANPNPDPALASDPQFKLELNSYIEKNRTGNPELFSQDVTFSGNINSFLLTQPGYVVSAFIKILPGDYSSSRLYEQILTSTDSNFSVTALGADVVGSDQIIQYGFYVYGLIVNDANDTGSAPYGGVEFQDPTADTNEFSVNSINVYPNPSNNVWNIKGQQIIENIQVFDVLGKQVMNVKPNLSDVQLDASTLPKGLYFAKMTTDLGSNSIKLIKN